MYKSNKLHPIPEEKNYRSSDRLLSFAAEFIDWRTKYKKTVPMTELYARYNEILADITGDSERQA